MKGLAATTTYISPATVPGVATSAGTTAVVPPLACAVSSDGYGLGNSGSAEPVKPPAGCASQGICNFFTDRYTHPTVQLPGCEYPQTTASYLSACRVPCVQGTTAQQAAAVKTRVDRDVHKCCN